jgi:hypothetical protein
VRQLAAAFSQASLLAGMTAHAEMAESKLAGPKAAASRRTPKEASVARTWGSGPRLFVVDWGRTARMHRDATTALFLFII